jgi:hypothetical protein
VTESERAVTSFPPLKKARPRALNQPVTSERKKTDTTEAMLATEEKGYDRSAVILKDGLKVGRTDQL